MPFSCHRFLGTPANQLSRVSHAGCVPSPRSRAIIGHLHRPSPLSWHGTEAGRLFQRPLHCRALWLVRWVLFLWSSSSLFFLNPICQNRRNSSHTLTKGLRPVRATCTYWTASRRWPTIRLPRPEYHPRQIRALVRARSHKSYAEPLRHVKLDLGRPSAQQLFVIVTVTVRVTTRSSR